MTILWLSPLDGCDICGHPFGDGEGKSKIMYDARVHGGWGNVCVMCFNSDPKAGLGTGRGQKYVLTQLEDRKAWVKTAG